MSFDYRTSDKANRPMPSPPIHFTFPPPFPPGGSQFSNSFSGQFAKTPMSPQTSAASYYTNNPVIGLGNNFVKHQTRVIDGKSDLTALVSKYRPVERAPKTKLNVSTVRLLLSNYKHLALSVERLSNYLEVTKKTLSDEAWGVKFKELEQKMNLLLESKHQIEDPHFVSLLQRTVGSAKKKRKRLSKKRREWRKIKEETSEFRQEKHKRIDLWLEKMQDQVERTRREETVKNEADLVLSDVYQKKSEGKRILGLLNSLKKLRNAEALQRESTKQQVSQGNASTFNEVIDKLKDMWTAQMNEYSKEEQGLKVMINDAAVERVSNEEKLWKSTLNSWTETLFGSTFLADPLQASPSDGERFFNVRREWDQFTTDGVSMLSSSIPSGYVVPARPSSDSWADLIAEIV